MRSLPLSLLLSLLLLSLVACGHRFSSNHALKEADRHVRTAPDSTLAIIDSLTPILTSPADRASLALLRLEERYRHDSIPSAVDDSLSELAISYFSEKADPAHLMRAYFLQGYNAIFRGDYEPGVTSLLRAERLALPLREHYWLGHIYRNIGQAYYAVSDYKSALAYFRKMETQFYEYGDSIYNRDSWILLSFIFQKIGPFEEAKTYADRYLKTGFEGNDSLLVAQAYQIKLYASQRLKQHDSTVYYVEKLLDFRPQSVDTFVMGSYCTALVQLNRFGKIDSIIRTMDFEENYSYTNIPHEYWAAKDDYKKATASALSLFNYYFTEVENARTQAISTNVREQLEVENLQKSLRLNRLGLYFSISLTALILIIGGLIFYNIRSKESRLKAERLALYLQDIVAERDSELNSVQDKLSETQTDIPKLKDSVFDLLGERYSELRRLYLLSIQGNASDENKDKFRQESERILKDLKGKSNVRKLGSYIDRYTDGLYSQVIEFVPDLKDEENAIFVYSCLGFPTSIIAVLLDMPEYNILNRKTRLKRKIVSAPLPSINEILHLLTRSKAKRSESDDNTDA